MCGLPCSALSGNTPVMSPSLRLVTRATRSLRSSHEPSRLCPPGSAGVIRCCSAVCGASAGAAPSAEGWSCGGLAGRGSLSPSVSASHGTCWLWSLHRAASAWFDFFLSDSRLPEKVARDQGRKSHDVGSAMFCPSHESQGRDNIGFVCRRGLWASHLQKRRTWLDVGFSVGFPGGGLL